MGRGRMRVDGGRGAKGRVVGMGGGGRVGRGENGWMDGRGGGWGGGEEGR